MSVLKKVAAALSVAVVATAALQGPAQSTSGRAAPEDAAAHGQLAVALQKLGYIEDARAEFERALALDDSIALVWSNFATLDANAGRYAAAREKWNRALAIDPRDDSARAALARLDANGKREK